MTKFNAAPEFDGTKVSLWYYSSRYEATVRKSSGRTAIASFMTKRPERGTDNRVRTRRVDPRRHLIKVSSDTLDKLTRRFTAFDSFESLTKQVGWRPTLGPEFWPMVLADAYDEAMRKRNDSRRVYRLGQK